MTGLIVLIILIVIIIVFVVVYKHGQKNGNLAEKEQLRIIAETSDVIRKLEARKQQESELKKEVFSNAEERKSELQRPVASVTSVVDKQNDDNYADEAGVNAGRDRFNRINDVLRSKPESRN
jgi:hypothetical protein